MQNRKIAKYFYQVAFMIEKIKLDQKFNQYKKSRESHIQEYLKDFDQFSTDIIKYIKGQAENVKNPVLIPELSKYIDLTTIQNKEIKLINNELKDILAKSKNPKHQIMIITSEMLSDSNPVKENKEFKLFDE